MPSILICGCGNMGGAMLTGWLASGMTPAQFTAMITRDFAKYQKLVRDVGAKVD